MKKELRKKGFFLLMEEIKEPICKEAVAWILSEHTKSFIDVNDNLTLIVNSRGGGLDPAFALVDTIQGSTIPITTIGTGIVSSAGLLIFLAGKYRVLSERAIVLSHQYSWGSYGKEHELYGAVKGFDIETKRMLAHYIQSTGLPEAEVKAKLLGPSDVWLNAEEALELGLCHEIKSPSLNMS